MPRTGLLPTTEQRNHALQLENGRLRAEVERLSIRAAHLESLLFEFVALERYGEAVEAYEAIDLKAG